MNANPRRRVSPGSALLIPIFLLLGACAEIAPPPGGPVDRSTPQIVATIPENGAVNITSLDKIVISFSERIVKPVTGRSIFLSPRPAKEPIITWSGDRIEIELKDSLRSNQTYLVSIASTVADLRGNKLDSTVTLAFSTGAALDSGRISGYVYRGDRPSPNTYAVLYDLTAMPDSIPLDSLPPDYLSLTNRDGYFSFSYLPSIEYRLAAFVDKNRNELLNPYREEFGVPDRAVIVGEEELLADLILPLTSQDTSRPDILSAAFTSDQLLRVRFGRAIPLTLLARQPGNARLIELEDTLSFYPGRGIVESHLGKSDAVRFDFGSVTDGFYRAEITYDASLPPVFLDTLKVQKSEDKIPPQITEFTPPDRALFLREIEMQLSVSEPLDTARINSESFLLFQGDSLSIPVAYEWQDPMHLKFAAALESGMRYQFQIAEFDLVDLAGNALGDSVATYSFSVLDTDSLGAIAGKVAVLVPGKISDEVVLTFNRTDRKQSFDLPVRGHDFRIQVPAGRYTISGFVDSNGNGLLDDGLIVPFSFSETRLVLTDTVAVRARFETAGIEVTFK